ncbi:AarF/ABC1/UbiB kinase family protein [Streptomyces sp. AC495_CC817]|uniref:ABC1 kinase family protein n=1 Tax=Streptomyces sp. AC495_CC817 TaxID=2823900 RepID=UPI001C26C90D|nr:AarF/UbiB family protein [Streptomyces sp. AC495_CC817]
MGAPLTTGAGGRAPADRARYRRILGFASRQLVQLWWFELFLPRIGFGRLSDRSRTRRLQLLARRFHGLAVELGGLMIKVGQFLSSRLDVLPPEITDELAGLQDEVPAVPFAQIRELAEVELGAPLSQIYAFFDETPVAAASLGQAHRARLSAPDALDTGLGHVIVKVQRPGIDRIVATDLAALRKVGVWLSRVRAVSSRVDAPALVEEFAHTSLEEIDYLHEAASAERFADDFADDDSIRTPAVVWARSTRRVLTLQDVTAIKISDTDALRAAGIDPSDVAAAFARAMFDQVFGHGFVHADPHPGNVFVEPAGDGAFRLTFIDFGMMAEVPASLRGGLRSLVIAIAARDGRAMIEAARAIDVLMPTTETAELERALTALFDRFGGMGFGQLKDVDPREFQDFADQFGHVMRSLPFQLPERLLLLIRAVSLTSGMCSALDPDFNVWDAVEPYATQLLSEESSGLMRDMATQAAASAGILWRLPQRVDSLLTRIDQGAVTFDTSRLERRLDRLEHVARRIASGVLFAALLVGGAILLVPAPPLAIVLMAASAVPFLHAVFARPPR